MFNKKRFAASLLSLTMLSAPAFTALQTMPVYADPGETEPETDPVVYKIYQIFKGTEATEGTEKVLGIEGWGSGVNGDNLLAELKNDVSTKITYKNEGADTTKTFKQIFERCSTPADVAAVLGDKTMFPDSSANAHAFAEVVEKFVKKPPTKELKKSEATKDIVLNPGYYLIIDARKEITDKTDSVNLNLLKITQSGKITIQDKKNTPEVDKTVEDQDTATEGKEFDSNHTTFDETADHKIGQVFRFKITTTIPVDEAFTKYTAYKAILHDTYSKGVDYEGDDTVEVTANLYKSGNPDNSTTINVNDLQKSVLSTVASPDVKETSGNADGGGEITITFADLKGSNVIKTAEIGDEIVIEVTYQAKLNANAKVRNADLAKGSEAEDNFNKVYLEYSNDPYDESGGKTGNTETDHTWVFSYLLDNTKYGEAEQEGNELAGAKFYLYRPNAEGTSYDSEKPVNLILDTTDNAYRPVLDGEEATAITTAQGDSKGKFNIKGLDAGTYWLVEDQAPAGYNKVAPIKVVINPTHSETDDLPVLQLNKATDPANPRPNDSINMENKVVDAKGKTLPSTGGTGTLLFYAAGAVAAAGAAFGLLPSRKKTSRS